MGGEKKTFSRYLQKFLEADEKKEGSSSTPPLPPSNPLGESTLDLVPFASPVIDIAPLVMIPPPHEQQPLAFPAFIVISSDPTMKTPRMFVREGGQPMEGRRFFDQEDEEDVTNGQLMGGKRICDPDEDYDTFYE
ncbi:hypothetical protein EJB05_32482, partial [Eragrostis curvula]